MKPIFATLTIILLAACANGSGSLNSPQTTAQRIEVYRSDNSTQCHGGGISPEAMQSELGAIPVFAARKDQLRGVAFPAVCGGATGSINVYTISQDNQAAAEKLGFRVFQAQE